jgi:hypothetical protein
VREITDFDLALQQAQYSAQELALAIIDADNALANASALQHDIEWERMKAEQAAQSPT